MAKQLTNQQNWRPWKAVLLFFIAIFVIVFGSVLVMHIGMTGLIISQLGLLATAIIACLINKTPLKEVFPIKKITVRDLFGSLLMWAGGVSFGIMSIYLSGLLTPKMSEQVSNGLSGLITSSSVLVIFIGTVILPPICEEAICRGAILSNLRSIKKDWVIVLIMGLFFGIMHMSPLRFLNTAVLGGMLSYLMVKKNNILLPMLLHFMNNFASVTIGYLGNNAADTAKATEDIMNWDGLTLFGSYMFLGFAAPIFLVLAMMFLDRKNHKAYRFAIAGGISFAMMAGGFGLMILAAMNFPI